MFEVRKTDVFAEENLRLQGMLLICIRSLILLQTAENALTISVQVRVERLTAGNPGDARPVGEGVSELRIDYGQGYRVYCKKQGRAIIV